MNGPDPRKKSRAVSPAPSGPAPGATARERTLAAFAVGTFAFLIYLRTLSPGLHFGDGPELAAAAHCLGVPHPTGYPLYMLLLKLASLLPVGGEVISRTTMATAAFGAAGAGVSTLVINAVLERLLPAWTSKGRLVAAAAGALGSAFMKFYWDNSTVTETYTLHFLLMIVFLRAIQVYADGQSPWALTVATGVVGLGLAHHRLAVVALLPLAAAWLTAFRGGERRLIMRPLVIAVSAFAASLLLYAYLPLRAAAQPPINWGNVRSAGAFVDHIRGEGYVQYRLLQAAPGHPFTADTYGRFAGIITRQVTGDYTGQFVGVTRSAFHDPAFQRGFVLPSSMLPRGTTVIPYAESGWHPIRHAAAPVSAILLAASAFGIFLWLRVSCPVALAAMVMALQNLVVIYLYNIPDISDYCLFPYWLAWVCLWLAILFGLDRATRSWRIASVAKPELAYLLMAAPLLIGAANWDRCNRSNDTAAEEYSSWILPLEKKFLPEDSVLVTAGDADTFTSWYRQVVRAERRDVLVFASNFAHRQWYRAFFTEQQIARYGLKFFSDVTRSPKGFADQVDEAVLAANVGRRPVYTTIEDPFVLRELSSRYSLLRTSEISVAGMVPGVPETTMTLIRIEPAGQQPLSTAADAGPQSSDAGRTP